MSAIISTCGKYRYHLRRQVSESIATIGKPMVFIMLNPSTADAETDDPTIRRCMGFAKREGCTTLEVVNIFAYRSTDPAALKRLAWYDAVGEENNDHVGMTLASARSRGGIIIAAWGASFPAATARARRVLRPYGPFWCLGTAKGGHPRHPLFVRKDQPLLKWGEGA